MNTRTRTRYAEYTADWDSFWQDALVGKARIVWDAPPESAVGAHTEHFEEYFDAALPVVDLGCGNGRQTAHLAAHHGRALGFDLAAGAVELARGAHPSVDFRRLDATDLDAMRELHRELGDMNLYVRGVLHQCDLEYRQLVIEGIAVLIGERGHAFVVQPSETVKDILADLEGESAALSPLLRDHVETRVEQMGLTDEILPRLFAGQGLKVAAEGQLEHPLPPQPDGTRIVLRSVWLVAGHGC